MTHRPFIKPGDWIDVGSVACVVSAVRQPGHPSGDCEVVFNALKPASHDVEWDGDDWRFVTRGNSGGPADRYPRLAPYVVQLKAGRPQLLAAARLRPAGFVIFGPACAATCAEDADMYGPFTKAAVEKFQAAHPPLEVDGWCGPETFAVLKEKVARLR